MQCKNCKKAKKSKFYYLVLKTQKIKVQNTAHTKLTHRGKKRVKIQHGGQRSKSNTGDKDQNPG